VQGRKEVGQALADSGARLRQEDLVVPQRSPHGLGHLHLTRPVLVKRKFGELAARAKEGLEIGIFRAGTLHEGEE
jgi:hypothetical protein